MPFDLHLQFFLPVPPQQVMELLTNPVLIEEWSGDKAVVETKEGGNFEMFGGWVRGKVLTATESELAYTWKPGNWTETDQPSEVRYKLEAGDEGTQITLAHTGFPNTEEMDGHETGWTEQFFESIEEYILSEHTAD